MAFLWCKRLRCWPAIAFAALAFVLSLWGRADAESVFLFVDALEDNEASEQKADTIEHLLETLLAQATDTVQVVPENRRSGRTVESYVDDEKTARYVHASVLAEDAGIFLKLHLVTPEAEKKTSMTWGQQVSGDVTSLNRKLHQIMDLYRAMLAGYEPGKLVFVGCFTPTNSELEPVSTRLTTGLFSRMAATEIGETFWMQGMTPAEFVSSCEGPEALSEAEIFDYVVEGYVISTGNADGADISVVVQVHHRKFPPVSYELVAQSLHELTVTQELAEFVAECWERWEDDICSP